MRGLAGAVSVGSRTDGDGIGGGCSGGASTTAEVGDGGGRSTGAAAGGSLAESTAAGGGVATAGSGLMYVGAPTPTLDESPVSGATSTGVDGAGAQFTKYLTIYRKIIVSLS